MPGPQRHVFCVDNAASFREIIRDLFEEEGYQVSTAAFSPDVCDDILRLEPDLVMLDLSIACPDGWDLLACLEEHPVTAYLPVLVVSTDPRQIAAAVAASPEGRPRAYRCKPFEIDDIIADVVRLIGTA